MCLGYGYIVTQCPSKEAFVMRDEEVVEIAEVDEEGSDGNEVEEVPAMGVDGEALPINRFVRRILNVPPVVDQARCKNIIHIKFLVNDVVCMAMIDLSSCGNVLATTHVNKLKLPTIRNYWMTNKDLLK